MQLANAKIEVGNVVTSTRRLLLLLVAALLVVAMTVVTAGPALASDLTKDPAEEKKGEGSGAEKAKKAAKEFLKKNS